MALTTFNSTNRLFGLSKLPLYTLKNNLGDQQGITTTTKSGGKLLLIEYNSSVLNYTLNLNYDKNCEIIMCGGGGSGGNYNNIYLANSGGGGGGGVYYNNSLPISKGTYTITIGIGGAEKSGYGNGYSGNPTTFVGITCGGGGAGTASTVGASCSGGSGGTVIGYTSGTGTTGARGGFITYIGGSNTSEFSYSKTSATSDVTAYTTNIFITNNNSYSGGGGYASGVYGGGGGATNGSNTYGGGASGIATPQGMGAPRGVLRLFIPN